VRDPVRRRRGPGGGLPGPPRAVDAIAGEYYKPDLIMTPISGRFVMRPREAAYATGYWLA
jgi:hypothetical protein